MQALATLDPLNRRIADALAVLAMAITLVLIIPLIIVCGMTGVINEVFDPEPNEKDSESGANCW